MRNLKRAMSALWIGAALTGVTVAPSVAQDTHVIGVKRVAWTYKDAVSTPSKVLAVDDLQKGDVVEVDIDTGSHGFVTTKKDADGNDEEARDLVLACGEDPASKPNATLKEVDCGAASHFGLEFRGKMRMQVLETFKDNVAFFCVVHGAAMPGVLKLKP